MARVWIRYCGQKNRRDAASLASRAADKLACLCPVVAHDQEQIDELQSPIRDVIQLSQHDQPMACYVSRPPRWGNRVTQSWLMGSRDLLLHCGDRLAYDLHHLVYLVRTDD